MNNQTLGTIAMICAPALLIEGLLVRGGENATITGIASMVFMAGWICTNTGMRRMQAAGTGKWGRTVLLIQLAGLVLAFLFGFFEATGLLGRDSVIFNVTDAAWPLSMLWMLVVGITVIAANRLSGWRRVVPLLCPLWLLVALGGGAERDRGKARLGWLRIPLLFLAASTLDGSCEPCRSPVRSTTTSRPPAGAGGHGGVVLGPTVCAEPRVRLARRSERVRGEHLPHGRAGDTCPGRSSAAPLSELSLRS